MSFGGLRYLIKQGWKNMGANRLMTFASVGVLTACFIITGVAVLLWANVENIVNFLSAQNEINVMLMAEVDTEQAAAIEQTIRDIPNVAEVTFVSKDDAYQWMKELLDNYGNLIDGYGTIFPARFLVTVDNLEQLQQTDAALRAVPGVESTYMPLELADVMITLQNGVTYAGMGIVLLLAVVSVIVVVNTIRLTVFARRREISIMKYVGATNTFIRMPFFVEGMTVGIIAGLLSGGVICGGYYLVYDFLTGMHNMWVMGILDSFIKLSDIWYKIIIALVVGGVLLGGVGTAFSIRKHLKV